MESKEKIKKMTAWNNGFLQLLINLALLALALYLCIDASENSYALGAILGGICWVLWGLHVGGFKQMVIQPNHARVLTFFGKYVGTVRDNGFFWTNPLYMRKKMSLRADNMDVAPIKVNDRNGNPIMIGLVLVWKVEDTYRACFDIEANSYHNFVAVQSDSALRKVASLYAYDNLEDKNELTLRNGGDEINRRLEGEIRKHLEIAGGSYQLPSLRTGDCQRDAQASAGRSHHRRSRKDSRGCRLDGRHGPEETDRRAGGGDGQRAQSRHGEQPNGSALWRRGCQPRNQYR